MRKVGDKCDQCGDLNGNDIGGLYTSCCADCEHQFPNGIKVGNCGFCQGTGFVKNVNANNIEFIRASCSPEGYICR